MSRTTIRAISCIVLAALAACAEESVPSAPAASRATVYVVNYPLAYFARRVAGDRVEVVFPAPDDEDPAFWSPSDETIVAYQRADLVLLNGASYARWVDLASLPAARLVDTSAAFRDRLITMDDATVHAHGPGGAHEHGTVAFTTWLDPRLAIAQAEAIHAAFVRTWPEHRAELDAGLEGLRSDLAELDASLASALAPLAGVSLVPSHPVYQYLARRYGLELPSVHWEPGEPPTDAMWAELDEVLRDHPATWMIWEGEPVERTVAELRERGIGSVVVDPCGSRPVAGDYLGTMRANVARLRAMAVGDDRGAEEQVHSEQITE
ncbi:MAG: metal ABC transporter substrate-binding protein [Planctomycetota bacterium]|jgi:zinc transport system substrate-binding protein